MRIGYLSTAYHTSHLLQRLNLVDAQWKLCGTGPEIISGFRAGKIDLAYIGLPPALVGITKGVDIACIAGGHIEGTVIVGRTAGKSDGLKELTGLKVGVPAKGSIHDVIIRTVTKNLSCEIINYSWADLILEDYKMGKIDVVCGTPNLAVLTIKEGGKVLGGPGELWDFSPSYGILVRKELLPEKERWLLDFLIKHEWACNILGEATGFAAKVVAGKYSGLLAEEDVEKMMQLSPKYCAAMPKEYVQSTMAFAAAMKELGYINRQVSEEEIFAPKLVNLIHPFFHHYRREKEHQDGRLN